MTITIAIVGRPNVGKSTLFNRLIGRKHAIVDDEPGITRDRREGIGSLASLSFNVIDTAGLEEADSGTLEDRMRRQTETAINNADITLMVVDVKAGVTPTDIFFANEIRKSGACVVLVANKCEGKLGSVGLAEAWSLGFGAPVPISAVHGEGLVDLHDSMLEAAAFLGIDSILLGEEDEKSGNYFSNETVTNEEKLVPEMNLQVVWQDKQIDQPMRIAVVGRPNMGKSTLINSLLNEERLLTGPEAGITRDSIEVPFVLNGKPYKLVDTAGMRRRSRVTEKVEKLTISDALRAIQYAHVCILLVDATEDIHKQDLSIARLIEDEGRAVVIGVNKWDAVRNKESTQEKISKRLQASLAQLRGLPVVQISGLHKKGLKKLLEAADEIYGVWNTRISTGQLNRWLDHMLEAHPPPLVEGRRLRIRYITQIKTRPPSFALFVSRPKDFPESYLRYLTGGLRTDFGLSGVPIRMMMRKRENPFAAD